MTPLFLAQLDAKTAAEGIGANFLPWAIVGLCIALGFTVKAYLAKSAEVAALHVAQAAALEKAASERLADVKADAKEQREILSQIVPLSTKLTEGLEILERLTKE